MTKVFRINALASENTIRSRGQPVKGRPEPGYSPDFFNAFVALDFRNIAHLRWTFDVVTSFWNSIGVGSRRDDVDVLCGVRHILRPGGRLLLDLYHPDWLAAHQLSGVVDPRGATVDRWLEDGRSCHCFRYANWHVDDIRFQVYRPDEIEAHVNAAGLTVERRFAARI